METLMSAVIGALSGKASREMIVFIISMIPILELRGGLLAASVLNIDIVRALWICIVGNLIPVPFILLLITPIFNWLKQTKTFRPMVEKMENRALSKREQIEKYEFWGLVLFVGIPLPGTGAWTGSLIAAMLDLRLKKAFPAIALGVAAAGVIMTFFYYFLAYAFPDVSYYLIVALVAAIVVAAVLIAFVIKKLRRRKNQ